ncbi:hypothetical protein CDCA_CDCA05G1555 [Cyanidium caldarium]|uniref:Methyltransferase small domain-containing protein n=1 Tax=Cyanidium caldarium TaxID=2771 RepID=A0AAV9ITU3_CYACA|nr:hypothetical protein CDCA_CDCA05G1555 [Cyanidium caldarium]
MDLSAFPRVYPPSEDSHLLVDAVVSECLPATAEAPALLTAIEVGVGSGYVIEQVALHWERAMLTTSLYVLGTDINPEAVARARHLLFRCRSVITDFILTDTVSGIRYEAADWIWMNPPYVCTSAAECREAQARRDIAAAWAGGEHGTQIIQRWLCALGKGDRGDDERRQSSPSVLLVAPESCRPPSTQHIVLRRRAGDERLWVLRL